MATGDRERPTPAGIPQAMDAHSHVVCELAIRGNAKVQCLQKIVCTRRNPSRGSSSHPGLLKQWPEDCQGCSTSKLILSIVLSICYAHLLFDCLLCVLVLQPLDFPGRPLRFLGVEPGQLRHKLGVLLCRVVSPYGRFRAQIHLACKIPDGGGFGCEGDQHTLG